eukprot:scaffold53139_cov69-Phaeocystis_antarctica.AAC.7
MGTYVVGVRAVGRGVCRTAGLRVAEAQRRRRTARRQRRTAQRRRRTADGLGECDGANITTDASLMRNGAMSFAAQGPRQPPAVLAFRRLDNTNPILIVQRGLASQCSLDDPAAHGGGGQWKSENTPKAAHDRRVNAGCLVRGAD